MKRLVVTAVCMLTLLVNSWGQNDKSAKELYFIYIAHDENTAVGSLVNRLSEIYDDARNYPEERELIIYLANDDDPKVVQVNTDNDNQNDFGFIVNDLQTKTSHTINPIVDRETIISIFNENDIIDEEGNPRYRFVDWNYYVNSTFWSLGNNEDIIAALFFIMNMEKMIESGYMRVSVLYGEGEGLKYNKTLPFGTKGLYKDRFMPLPY